MIPDEHWNFIVVPELEREIDSCNLILQQIGKRNIEADRIIKRLQEYRTEYMQRTGRDYEVQVRWM